MSESKKSNREKTQILELELILRKCKKKNKTANLKGEREKKKTVLILGV